LSGDPGLAHCESPACILALCAGLLQISQKTTIGRDGAFPAEDGGYHVTSNTRLRVLHSFGSLGVGGLETWLMNILRLHPEELQFDFILDTPGGAYESEARGYGCQIHYAPPIRQLGKTLRFLENVLRSNPYDVYHIHGEEFMGDALKVASRVGIPVRVAHCHSTQLARGKKGIEMQLRSWRHKSLDRFRILRGATDIVAASNDAGRFLVGRAWAHDPRCKPLFCGVPLDQFRLALDQWSRAEFRKAQRIPHDAIVVGHAGSMGPSPVKNHLFIIKIFAELARRDQRYHLYLAGDGPQRPLLEQTVRDLGLQSRVSMPGLCADVPALMVHGFDVHLLPSLREGLPIVGLEAVAGGLHTVCSDTITKDFTLYFSQRVTQVSLKASPSIWAEQIVEAARKRISAREGIALVQQSPFSITSSREHLVSLYQNTMNHALRPKIS
jgi:glycosyltransferase involved in cell wall biosynthesis